MEKGSFLKRSTQDQPSPGALEETLTDKYSTCREEIADLETTSIQPCPIIPDFITPTLSTQPIVVRMQEECFCIDGGNYIEQAVAEGRTTIRCHIFHILHRSDTELAIRKAAIRVMPQGGKCSYAELVRNISQLYRALKNTSDDLVLFTHGGARRGDNFIDSKENNIRTVLANRLGKSQTTINKYIQHGDSINDAAMEELVKAGVPKAFFEAFQNEKVRIIAQQSEKKDPAAISEAISSEVMQWLEEAQNPDPQPKAEQKPTQSSQTEDSATQNPDPSTMIEHESTQTSEAESSVSQEEPTPSFNRNTAPEQRSQQQDQETPQDPPSDPIPTGEEDVHAELKGIGEALIEIADSQDISTPRQMESLQNLILELTVLFQRLSPSVNPKGKGGME